jgi:cell division protein FtsB
MRSVDPGDFRGGNQVPRQRNKRVQQSPVARRGWKRIRIPYILVILVMGLFAYSFLQRTQEIRRLNGEKIALQYQIEQTRLDDAQVRQDIRWYRQPAYIQEAARSLLSYTMPGDVPVEVQTSWQKVAPRISRPVSPVSQPPVWRQWWESFFG